MKWNSILLIAVVLGVIGLGIWQLQSKPETKILPLPPSTPTLSPEQVKGVREELEIKTASQLPADAEQTVLRDVSGQGSSGITTRKFANQTFELNILADLPEPPSATHYQAWLVKGQPEQSDFNLLSAGNLESRKGGWVLEFTRNVDLNDHTGIVVTLETNNDQKPEIHILEGSF